MGNKVKCAIIRKRKKNSLYIICYNAVKNIARKVLSNMIIEIPEKVAYIIEKLMDNGFEAYAVGGCVRDTILGRIPEDWDITTSAKPDEVKSIFPRTIDTGIIHGTVTAMIDREGFEITTYRLDGEYEDNRHPKNVEFTSNLKEDLKRRDFTINAMAYNYKEGLVDCFGGINHIESKTITCVGNPEDRFDEDALRILRAVRFAGQLGFHIEEKTKKSMKNKVENLKNISAERIRVELDKLFRSNHAQLIEEAYKTHITKVVLPEFDKMMLTEQNNPHHIYNVGVHCMKSVCLLNEWYKNQDNYDKKIHTVLAWTMLLHDVGKPACKKTDKQGIDHFYGHDEVGANIAKGILKRLKFDNFTISLVVRLIRWHDYRMKPEDKNVRRGANKIGADIMSYLFVVQKMDILAQNPEKAEEKLTRLEAVKNCYEKILQREECLAIKDLKLNGNDLMEAGMKPGKQIGEALSYLLEVVLEQPDINEKEKLLDVCKRKYKLNS